MLFFSNYLKIKDILIEEDLLKKYYKNAYYNDEGSLIPKSSKITKKDADEVAGFGRDLISDKLHLFKFNVGDILVVFFWIKGLLYRFEGLCIAIKRKNILNINTTLLLRNVISGIGVELSISYFYNRLFYLKFSDFKRKQSIYNRAKLYYLRNALNRQSRVN